MADGGDFDPCECICSTQWAMRRLLSMLRTSQQYCTDTECLTEMPGSNGNSQQEFGMLFMMVLWLLVVVTLFFNRPASLRKPIGPNKSSSNDRDGSRRPPDVPPIQ